MSLPFGKKIQFGNFEVMKFTRAMSGRDIKAMRRKTSIPAEIRKNLQRVGLPFIKVTSMSGSWGLEFSAGTAMFRYIDEEDDKDALRTFFTMFFADTTTFGDQQYWDDKGKALMAYMKRIEAAKVSDADDAKTLDEQQSVEEHIERLQSVRKEVEDE